MLLLPIIAATSLGSSPASADCPATLAQAKRITVTWSNDQTTQVQWMRERRVQHTVTGKSPADPYNSQSILFEGLFSESTTSYLTGQKSLLETRYSAESLKLLPTFFPLKKDAIIEIAWELVPSLAYQASRRSSWHATVKVTGTESYSLGACRYPPFAIEIVQRNAEGTLEELNKILYSPDLKLKVREEAIMKSRHSKEISFKRHVVSIASGT
jgi:hypothetical protein